MKRVEEKGEQDSKATCHYRTRYYEVPSAVYHGNYPRPIAHQDEHSRGPLELESRVRPRSMQTSLHANTFTCHKPNARQDTRSRRSLSFASAATRLTRTRLTQAERTFRLQIPGSTELQPAYPQQEMRELLRSTYVHLSFTQMHGKMYSILRLTLYLITVPNLFLINRTILPSSMFCIL